MTNDFRYFIFLQESFCERDDDSDGSSADEKLMSRFFFLLRENGKTSGVRMKVLLILLRFLVDKHLTP